MVCQFRAVYVKPTLLTKSFINASVGLYDFYESLPLKVFLEFFVQVNDTYIKSWIKWTPARCKYAFCFVLLPFCSCHKGLAFMKFLDNYAHTKNGNTVMWYSSINSIYLYQIQTKVDSDQGQLAARTPDLYVSCTFYNHMKLL